MLKKYAGIGFTALALSVSGAGMVSAADPAPLAPMGSQPSSVGTSGVGGLSPTPGIFGEALKPISGGISDIKSSLGGLLGGGGLAKESTQNAHKIMHEIKWGLQIAESIKNNEFWLTNLSNLLGTNTSALLGEINGISGELSKHKGEMEIVFDESANAVATNAQHREFRKLQRDRSLARLEGLIETSKQIEDETIAERVAALESLQASEDAEGLLDVQQSTNELIGVNIATNQKIVTRLNDLVMVENQKESDRIERELADHAKFCAAMAAWPGFEGTGSCSAP